MTSKRLLTMLVIVSLLLNGVLLYLYLDLNNTVDDIDDDVEFFTDELIIAHEADNTTVDTASTEGHMAGYDTRDNTGYMFSYTYQPLPGESIYLDIQDVDIETDFQQSLRDTQDAFDGSSYSPGISGAVISTDTPSNWEFLRGQSASLEIAIQMAATNQNYTYNESVAATGRVDSNGYVNSVDHVGAKAESASEQNYSKFISPHTNYAVNVDSIEVVHVQTLDEALDIALEPAE